MVLLTTFYTSVHTEHKLNDIYEKHLQRKQNKDNGLGRVSEHAYVKKPAREFYVMDGVTYYKATTGREEAYHKCPTEPEDGGGTYRLEPALLKAVELFQSRYTTYRVVFEPHPYYVSQPYVVPATLYSIPCDEHDVPEILTIEIEDNYHL